MCRYDIALRRFVAVADVFVRQSDGATIADQYRQLGISLRPAATDRINGWAAIHKGLGDPASGVAHPLYPPQLHPPH